MIVLKKISHTFPSGIRVLDELDFSMGEGERIGITGDNGSGKTTLLHIIMGLIKPDSGRVVLFGERRKTEEDFRGARSRMGFVFQDADDQLFCPTVAEDVAFGPRNLGYTAPEALEIVQDTLEMLEIAHLERRVTYQLSAGEKRLVGIATALAMKPEVLVLDEPTAGLTEKAAKKVRKILKQHVPALLLVCHDGKFLSKSVDRIWKVENGKLRE